MRGLGASQKIEVQKMGKRKKGSKFLQAFGKAFEIWKVLTDAVLSAGGTDEDVARIQTDKNLLKELVEVIMKYAKAVSQPVAAVATAVKESFQNLLAACKQDGYRDPEFTESRWPLEPVAPDEDDYEEIEHHFTGTMTIEEGLRRLSEMETKGEIRLLKGSRRAMKYIAAHPNAQLDYSIILPLRAQDSNGGWVVPIFCHDGPRRFLDLCYLDGEADPDCSWLVLCQRPSVKS